MEYKSVIAGIVLAALFSGCKNEWDEHYNKVPETIDMNVWTAIQNDNNLSLFVQYIKDFEFDTLFLTDQTYTLFIPDNEAFSQYTDTGTINQSILYYLISTHFVLSGNVKGKKKIQTLGEKFALFDRSGSESYFDGISLKLESPLYRNGKYFILDKVALPKPNLYEYFAENNPILKSYIDSKDSVILDKELSRPLGFDDNGNTIYDTVSTKFNLFEYEFFPVSEELRYNTATIVFPKEEDYNNALTLMAQSIGSVYQDYKDIPLVWQNKVLIPYLMKFAVFENMLDEDAFMLKPGKDTLKMKNILGDSVIIDYQPIEKAILSNGYAYNWSGFRIPDTLFAKPYREEGEWLVKDIGINKYAWYDDVKVISDVSFQPIQELIAKASNDSILRVIFTNKYTGNFSVEFNVDNLFPRKYLMVVRTYMYLGGIYNIYVNDELVKTIDYYDYVLNRELYWSVTGIRYRPEAGYNKFDCWVENLVEYGKAKIKFEYVGYSEMINSGLSIDYIDFVPY